MTERSVLDKFRDARIAPRRSWNDELQTCCEPKGLRTSKTLAVAVPDLLKEHSPNRTDTAHRHVDLDGELMHETDLHAKFVRPVVVVWKG